MVLTTFNLRMSSMQGGKRKQDGIVVKIEPPAAPVVKSEQADEGTAPKKARMVDAPVAKKPMPAIVKKELFTAAAKAKVETIDRWVESYGVGFLDMVDSSDQKRPFLHHVIRHDNLEILKYLVQKQLVDVDCKIKVGENAFIFGITVAVGHDAHKCLAFLQENGARTTNVISHGISLAHEAVYHLAVNSLTSIARWGPHLLKERDNCGFTPLDYLSKKQGGNSCFTRARDLNSSGMKCVLLLAEHMDEQDAKTARYPFSQLFKNSPLMKMIKENYSPILNRNYYSISDTLERCMEQGHHDVVVFLIEAGVKFRSKIEIERAYHNAFQNSAPDSLVKTIENLLVDP